MILYGIDPGSHFMGLAKMVLNDKPEVEYVEALTISAKDEFDKGFYPNISFNDVTLEFRLALIDKAMVEHISEDANAIAIESSFYNSFRPAAFAVLLTQMATIDSSLREYFPHVDVFKFPPGTIKKAISVKKFKGKDPVTDAIKALELDKLLVRSAHIDELSEHAIDAIGIAYTALKDIE